MAPDRKVDRSEGKITRGHGSPGVDPSKGDFRCHTRDMADNEDIKERMRQALEAKNKKSAKNTPHGTAPTESNAQEHADREGGKREFRRKSG